MIQSHLQYWAGLGSTQPGFLVAEQLIFGENKDYEWLKGGKATKTIGVLFLILVAGIGNGFAQQNPAQKPKVRPDVSKRVQEKGVARVSLVLSGEWKLDSKLTHDAALAQRKAIDVAQDVLIAELAGTTYKVLRKPKMVPGLSLEVGPDALAVLENSEHVKEVYLDELVLKPGLSQSVPLIGGDQAWASGFNGTGHAIVVVDTGVDGSHPFLSTTIPGKGKKPPTIVS